MEALLILVVVAGIVAVVGRLVPLVQQLRSKRTARNSDPTLTSAAAAGQSPVFVRQPARWDASTETGTVPGSSAPSHGVESWKPGERILNDDFLVESEPARA
jgi:hypothetical protein